MNSQVKKEQFESKLGDQCRGVASCLSYNEDRNQGEAKHSLIEAAMCLYKHSVRVHPKKCGAVVINANGKQRRLTIRERIAIWLLRGKLEIRP